MNILAIAIISPTGLLGMGIGNIYITVLTLTNYTIWKKIRKNCTTGAEIPLVMDILQHMAVLMWQYARETNDHSLLNTHYPILRLAPVGPLSEDPTTHPHQDIRFFTTVSPENHIDYKKQGSYQCNQLNSDRNQSAKSF